MTTEKKPESYPLNPCPKCGTEMTSGCCSGTCGLCCPKCGYKPDRKSDPLVDRLVKEILNRRR